MKKLYVFILFCLPFLPLCSCNRPFCHRGIAHGGEKETVVLHQLTFKDTVFEKKITDIAENKYFKDTHYYVLDFLRSDLSENCFYLVISAFDAGEYPLDSISYYMVVNKVVFFVPNNVPDGLFNTLPVQKTFNLECADTYKSEDYVLVTFDALYGYYDLSHHAR